MFAGAESVPKESEWVSRKMVEEGEVSEDLEAGAGAVEYGALDGHTYLQGHGDKVSRLD